MKLVEGTNLLSLYAYLFNDIMYIIIGEDHWRTKREFGERLIRDLKNECNTSTKVTCLIEKHISNKNDPVQTALTCNMPNLAIHRFRCDEFLENHTCSNLTVIPVDNRHYDLGFFRMEVFSIWDESVNFKKFAIAFHKKTLQNLQNMAYILEQECLSNTNENKILNI